ncbi:SIMPL domain-containing protein [Sulfurimonas sp.]|uniref:SIMPL domain-containing protein n=1 Tax=Sulfurimonas sp. TaxID=2022749 RepID=UPI003D138CD3
MHFSKLLLLTLFTTASFGYELKVNKTFEENLESDRMELHFSFIAKKKSAKETKELLHPAIAIIKQHPQCKGGGYTLSPEYNYKSSKRELLGFVGRANFECSFKEVEEIDDITTFFDTQTNLELQQAPIKWVVGKENIKIAKTSLELKAIRYAKEYAQILKKENIAQCHEKKVEIHTSSSVMHEAQAMLMAKSSMETPTKEPTLISINATYEFECQ